MGTGRDEILKNYTTLTEVRDLASASTLKQEVALLIFTLMSATGCGVGSCTMYLQM